MHRTTQFKYEGEYNVFNQRHGLGRAYLRNGDKYEGTYEYGKRHGYGIYTFHNGAIYDGEWSNGRKTGSGKFIYPDGSQYDGQWLDDQRNGFGIYKYPNGDVYDGEWTNHQRHGHGKYVYFAAGMQYIGTWTHGVRDDLGDVMEINMAAFEEEMRLADIEREEIRKKNRPNDWSTIAPDKIPTSLRFIIGLPGAEGFTELASRLAWWNLEKEEEDCTYIPDPPPQQHGDKNRKRSKKKSRENTENMEK